MKIGIITNCSKSKKLPANDLLQAKNLPHGSLDTVTTEWVKRTEGHKDEPIKARDLYSGRSFKEIKKN